MNFLKKIFNGISNVIKYGKFFNVILKTIEFFRDEMKSAFPNELGDK